MHRDTMAQTWQQAVVTGFLQLSIWHLFVITACLEPLGYEFSYLFLLMVWLMTEFSGHEI